MQTASSHVQGEEVAQDQDHQHRQQRGGQELHHQALLREALRAQVLADDRHRLRRDQDVREGARGQDQHIRHVRPSGLPRGAQRVLQGHAGRHARLRRHRKAHLRLARQLARRGQAGPRDGQQHEQLREHRLRRLRQQDRQGQTSGGRVRRPPLGSPARLSLLRDVGQLRPRHQRDVRDTRERDMHDIRERRQAGHSTRRLESEQGAAGRHQSTQDGQGQLRTTRRQVRMLQRRGQQRLQATRQASTSRQKQLPGKWRRLQNPRGCQDRAIENYSLDKDHLFVYLFVCFSINKRSSSSCASMI